MRDQKSAQDVIEKFQKKQQRAPASFVIGALAILLIFAGGIVLFQWYTNPDAGIFSAFRATDTPTPTPTITSTPLPPTATSVPPTETSTPTDTPTITPTPTIDGPFIYAVEEGDLLSTIAEKFGVSVGRIMEVNGLDSDVIFLGQQLLIPDPNEELPTETPVPPDLRGEITYLVQSGDNITLIALKFNSTVEAIIEANEDLTEDNFNAIEIGQALIIPVNLVTPSPTDTPAPETTPGSIQTLTPTPEPTNTP